MLIPIVKCTEVIFVFREQLLRLPLHTEKWTVWCGLHAEGSTNPNLYQVNHIKGETITLLGAKF